MLGMKYQVGDTVEVMKIKPGTIDTPLTRSCVGKSFKVVRTIDVEGGVYQLEDMPQYWWYPSELTYRY